MSDGWLLQRIARGFEAVEHDTNPAVDSTPRVDHDFQVGEAVERTIFDPDRPPELVVSSLRSS